MDIHMLVMLVFIFVTDVKAFSFITWYEFSWALHRQFFSLGNFRTSPILETHHGVLLLQSSVSFYFRSVFLVDFMFINEFEEWKWMICLTFLFWIQLSFNWCFSYLLPISSYLLKSAFSIKMLNFFFLAFIKYTWILVEKNWKYFVGVFCIRWHCGIPWHNKVLLDYYFCGIFMHLENLHIGQF